MLTLLIIIVVFFMATGLFINIYMSDLLIQKTMSFERANMSRANEILYSYFEKIDRIMNMVVYDLSIQTFLTSDDIYERTMTMSEIRSIAFNFIELEPSIKDLSLISPEGKSCAIGKLGALTQKLHTQLNMATPPKSSVLSYTIHKTNDHNTILVFKPIYRYHPKKLLVDEYIGYCVFELDIQNFWNTLVNTNSVENYMTLLLDQNGTVVVQTNENHSGDYPAVDLLLKAVENNQSIISDQKKNFILASTEIPNTGFIGIIIAPVEQVLQQLNFSTKVIYGLVVLIVLSIVFIYFQFVKNMKKDVDILLGAMEKAAENDMEARAVINRNNKNEFKILADGFNLMIQRIQKLHSDNLDIKNNLYKKEIESKDAKIFALQSQLNPHFLYNTLDCMKGMGLYYKIDGIKDIAISLASLLKYNVKSGNFVQVQDELTCVKHFLAIQNIRFPEKVEFVFHIEEAVKTCTIPKFILQPLIENSYIHGIEPKLGKGQIILSIFKDADTLCIVIKDDGVGMDEKECKLIQNTLESCLADKDNHECIGLKNIARRIYLYYNQKGKITLESSREMGTLIKISIPATGLEEEI